MPFSQLMTSSPNCSLIFQNSRIPHKLIHLFHLITEEASFLNSSLRNVLSRPSCECSTHCDATTKANAMNNTAGLLESLLHSTSDVRSVSGRRKDF